MCVACAVCCDAPGGVVDVVPLLEKECGWCGVGDGERVVCAAGLVAVDAAVAISG